MVRVCTYQSCALILRITASDGEGNIVEVWRPSKSSESAAENCFVPLQERPTWVKGPETVELLARSITFTRLGLPPSMYFKDGDPLEVISVYPAISSTTESSLGIWVPSEKLLAQVDAQWQSVLSGICSQFAHAVRSGYLGAASWDAKASEATSTAQQKGESSRDGQTTPAALSPKGNLESEEQRQNHANFSSPGCSGYDEEGHAWGDTVNQGESAAEEEEGSVASDNTEEELRLGESRAEEPALQWQPGKVAIVEQGGRDMQSVLDASGVKLGIIDWHARWIEACLEIQPYMQRLAARFRSVAIMKLDVECSMANKLLAYEKVLTRSESRRKGAKPVVRNNQNFPCLTVHDPSNAIPKQTFCGKDALDQLAEFALLGRSKELIEAPAQENKISGSPGLSSALPSADQQAPGPCSSNFEPDESSAKRMAKQPGDPGSKTASKSSPLENIVIIKRGAIELRQHLYEAKQEGKRVVLLWTSGNAGPGLNSFAAAQPGAVFLHADVTLGKDNRQLARSLKVKHYPTIQVYLNMKLVKHIDQKGAGKDLEQTLSSIFSSLDSHPSCKPEETPIAKRNGSSKGEADSSVAEEESAGRGLEGGKALDDSRERSSKPHEDSFDPPKQASKAEQKRRFSSGIGIYWPKMPCLTCGCPWWLGEDWDARCARCGWTAEKDGYDDDSQPLPKYKARYKQFTETIKGGRTPEWTS